MDNKQDLLIRNIARFKNREWLNAALDVLKEGLDAVELESNNPALSMTVNKDGSLNINIGQRWIWKANDDKTVSLILPLGIDAESLGADSVMAPFTRAGVPDAQWASFPLDATRGLSTSLKRHWIDALEGEVRRTKKSGFRKYHSELLWETVMLQEVREEIFGLAFK